MQLITESYREQLAGLHDTGNFGVAGDRHSHGIGSIADMAQAKTILDYGSGKACWTARDLGDRFDVRSYDPAIPELSARPEPADLVVCADVLEHVEPDLLANVLDDVQRCTLRALFVIVSTKPAKKNLPDGRNAHLIQQTPEWWLPHFCTRWRIANIDVQRNGWFGMFLRK